MGLGPMRLYEFGCLIETVHCMEGAIALVGSGEWPIRIMPTDTSTYS
jgi:hypothetical protein